MAAVAHQVGMPFVDLDETSIEPSVDRLIPAELARASVAVAIEPRGAELLVAMADPGDSAAVLTIEEATGWKVLPAVAEREELRRLLDAMYGRSASPSPNGGRAKSSGEEIEISFAEEPMPATGPEVVGRLGDESKAGDLHVNDLLERVVDLGGSDLHLTSGIHPAVRVNGELKALTEFPEMNGSEIRRMIYAILTQRQRERFESELELDTSHAIPGLGRFRVNVFLQRDSMGAVMRVIPFDIVPLDQLGLPPAVAGLAELPRGLVLLTGPTGSGKSTTLASLVDIINSDKPVHIMTVEDPIEFLHNHKRAVVNQREVGEDTNSFASALKHVLRQDPDVILVGEMRDLETIQTALTAAETGHLVFATLHTQSAPEAVDRIIDVFPPHQQQQVRTQLGATIMGIVTQQLLQTADGAGRVIACEVLVATPAVRNLIREGKTHMIYSSMQAGGTHGMQTMDQALGLLVRENKITFELGLERCHSAEEFARLAGRG